MVAQLVMVSSKHRSAGLPSPPVRAGEERHYRGGFYGVKLFFPGDDRIGAAKG